MVVDCKEFPSKKTMRNLECCD